MATSEQKRVSPAGKIGIWRLLSTALLERWPQVCRVKITFTVLMTNRFVFTTQISMKCVVKWIPLRIWVRFTNTQPHLKFATRSAYHWPKLGLYRLCGFLHDLDTF